MTLLSIIIVTYNSRADIDGCLTSLTATPPSVAHEIAVVDNASTDGTVAFVRERWPSVRVIEAGTNAGFAAANNLGMRQTSAELILLLNPDTIVRPPAIDRLVAALDAHADVAVVGPRIVDGQGRAELSFGSMISPFVELRQKVLVVGTDRQAPLIAGYVDRLTRREQHVDWVSGACLMVRRADADAAGLMDERYFMYTEDVDFCASIRARGRTVLFTPSAEIVHLRGRSAASAPRATEAAYRRSQIAFYEKHHPAWAPALRLYIKLRDR